MQVSTLQSEPTLSLRLLRSPNTSTDPDRLQQQWAVTRYDNGKPIARNYEWRDVPVVVEDATP